MDRNLVDFAIAVSCINMAFMTTKVRNQVGKI